MLNKNNNKKIFVGLSGGVDSAVCAYLLKKQGFDVVGVYIKTWQPDFIKCTWPEERRDAMRVCAHLGIPFLMFDFAEDYKKLVADKFIEDYKKGLTPNPDILCNREIKFGLFWEKAKFMGADFISTGHYARIVESEKLKVIKYELAKGIDESKDQAYFLWTLTEDDLSHTIFPLGNLKKTQVRQIAKKVKLPMAEKKDSQGICFIGDISMKEFLKNYIPERKGIVRDEKGEVIGEHDGVEFYTLGERHGFTLNAEMMRNLRKTMQKETPPMYVVKKDLEKNELVVSSKPVASSQSPVANIVLKNINIMRDLKVGEKYKAQIRYHGEYLDCIIKEIKKENLILELKENVLVSCGQSVVVYDGYIIVAGGVVL